MSDAKPILTPTLLARGPWPLDRVQAHWHEERYAPSSAAAARADEAIANLRGRGSPSHDGWGARLLAHHLEGDQLVLELQPVRWALRLLADDAQGSMAALCVTRDAAGRWLAGRRAHWLSSWPGRWALGAGGAVDLGESPAQTLVRELQEEWSVTPERARVEALLRLPQHLYMLVGQAWLPDGAEVVPDDEHDEFAWWPAEIEHWPPEAHASLRTMAHQLDG
jgi:8-oxo-dGTP pyrophosphatase MutT (NUDIX family)